MYFFLEYVIDLGSLLTLQFVGSMGVICNVQNCSQLQMKQYLPEYNTALSCSSTHYSCIAETDLGKDWKLVDNYIDV